MKAKTEEVLFSSAALIFAAGVASLLAYETWALANDKPPITWRVRKMAVDHPNVTSFSALAIGLLLGHLFLGKVSSVEGKYEV